MSWASSYHQYLVQCSVYVIFYLAYLYSICATKEFEAPNIVDIYEIIPGMLSITSPLLGTTTQVVLYMHCPI